jgi:uncharacterized cupredoxin-like copper-binding protein
MKRGLVGIAGFSLAALTLIAAACGGGKSGGKEAGPTNSPQVSLKDFSITGPADVTTGAVTFSISNGGPSVHEFVIVKTDLTLAGLPTTIENGVPVLDEESTDLQAVDEREDIAPGTTTTLPVTLAPGHYVMFCNIPGHFESGMVADFTVSS